MITKDGELFYLGEFVDKALAMRIRMEAEQLPPSEYPALKAKYKALKQNGAGHVAPSPEPAETQAIGLSRSELAETIAQIELVESSDVLSAKLAAARTAERDYQVALADLEKVQAAACDAEQRAIAAWNDVAEALAELGMTSAFDKSALGFIREEIARP